MSGTYSDGHFPFGRPNTTCEMREATNGRAQVLFIGVYPSAFHVRWTAPTHLGGRVAGALPVDVEPTVFWAGDPDGGAARLAGWKETVGFVEGDGPGAHGRVSALAGGPMGKVLKARYFDCLDATAGECAFTDVHPVYLVHRNGKTGAGRGGGDAIDLEYNRLASQLGMRPSHIPTRPTPSSFVEMAAKRFTPHILADLEKANAPLVVTLGDEAMQVLLTIGELDPDAPKRTLPALKTAGLYGTSGHLTVNGQRVRWIPLVHPNALGFGQKSTVGAEGKEPAEQTPPVADADLSWSEVHDRWCEQMRRERGTDT